eukprot:TRINITY_DN29810_c0_g2_i1.p1 TRINITY_DN29810_c0_g2~~TRINITY_DN29810_c0_g2_i1.p1  ORF type:complete len:291 (-),score=41.81 TRINITY_DN29810_c0_g2_i1:67-939(-)
MSEACTGEKPKNLNKNPVSEETDERTAISCEHVEVDDASVESEEEEEEEWPCFSDISALKHLRGELLERTAHEAQQYPVSDGIHATSANAKLEVTGDLPSIGSALHGRDCLPCKFLKCRNGCLRGNLCTMCHSDDHENLTYGMRNKLHKRKHRGVLIQPWGPDAAVKSAAGPPKQSVSESRSAPEDSYSESRPTPLVVVGKFYKPLGDFHALQPAPLQPLMSSMNSYRQAESGVHDLQAIATCTAPYVEEGDDWSDGAKLHPTSCIPCKWMKRRGGCLSGCRRTVHKTQK